MQIVILFTLFIIIIGLIFFDRFLTQLNYAMSVECPFCSFSPVRETSINLSGNRRPAMIAYYLALAVSKPRFHCPRCEKEFGVEKVNDGERNSILKSQNQIKYLLAGFFIVILSAGFTINFFLKNNS